MENTETDVWLQFSYACEYITEEESFSLNAKNVAVGKMLAYMLQNPDKYCK